MTKYLYGVLTGTLLTLIIGVFAVQLYNAKEIENHNHGYPHLGYRWNKYLLCSIVSRYFSDEFEVVNVTDKYGTEEYIIKPCK